MIGLFETTSMHHWILLMINYLTSKLSDQIKVGVKFKNLSKTGIVIEAKLKKCDDKKYPIYNIKRSSVCGVYGYRNIRNASCGVESYQRCTPDPVKMGGLILHIGRMVWEVMIIVERLEIISLG